MTLVALDIFALAMILPFGFNILTECWVVISNWYPSVDGPFVINLLSFPGQPFRPRPAQNQFLSTFINNQLNRNICSAKIQKKKRREFYWRKGMAKIHKHQHFILLLESPIPKSLDCWLVKWRTYRQQL